MSSPASRYTLAKTKSSLTGAAVICGVFTLTHLVEIQWVRAASFGLAEGQSPGAIASFFGAIGFFLNATLFLLALLAGPIGTHRGALKLGIARLATAGLVIISFLPPVALVVHGALLFRLHKQRSMFADEGATPTPRFTPCWIAPVVCFAVAVAAQFSFFSSARKAEAAHQDYLSITQSSGNPALFNDLLNQIQYGQDFGATLQNLSRENAIRRGEAQSRVEAFVRRANLSIHVSNLAVLAALAATVSAGVSGARAKKASSAASPSLMPSPTPRVTPAPAAAPSSTSTARAVPPPWPGAAQAAEAPREFFLIRKNEQCGPYSESVLRSLVQAGEVQETDYCWTEGWDDWRPVGEGLKQA